MYVHMFVWVNALYWAKLLGEPHHVSEFFFTCQIPVLLGTQ